MANNMSKLDAFQVLKSVYDTPNNALRVSVVEGTTGGGAGFEVIISHTDDSIRLGDGTKLTTATQVGSQVGLDVNILNGISIGDLDASKDNVAIRDSDGDELAINPDGSINTNTTVDLDAATGDNVAIGNTWKKLIDQPTATVTYIGLANPGTLAGAATWQIKRINVVGSLTAIEFADGNLNFDNVWNNRAILSYS